MGIFLFITVSVSMLVVGFGYFSDGFTEINVFVRLGWAGLFFSVLVLCFSFIRVTIGAAFISLKKVTSRLVRAVTQNERGSDAFDADRRVLLKRSLDMGIVVASGGLAYRGALEGLHAPEVIRARATFKDLPESLVGFRIVQISDIHANIAMKREWIQAVVDRVNALSPDLIAFTGDFVDDTVPNLRDTVAPLSDLSARFGRYYVTGNHDYVRAYGGVDAWLEELVRLGFTPLLNEHRLLRKGAGGLVVAGVTDYSTIYRTPAHVAGPGGSILHKHPEHPSDPRAAIQGAPDSDVKILLAHQPKSIHKAAEVGFDLQLSGHTHGGQFFPGQIVQGLFQPYVSGLHMYKKTRIYVNRATGYWGPPLRLGVPSEITLLTLGRTV